jgi:hypothetical protein
MFGKVFSGIFGGLIIAIIGTLLVVVATASDRESDGSTGTIVFFVMWAIGLTIALAASRAGKAWRRLLIIAGLLAFAMPLSSLIFANNEVINAANEGGDYAGAAATGAAIGGGLVTAISGFLGFFLGVIFLVIGLLVGRDQKVIIVKETSNEN